MIKYIILCCALGCYAGVLTAQPDDIPFAQPGKCYAKCFIPEKYETVTENVVLRDSLSEARAVQAQFETVTAEYVSKEAAKRLIAEPAVFDTIQEKIMVVPPGKRLPKTAYDTLREVITIRPETKLFAVSDAVFETVNGPVITEDAYTVLEVLPQRYEPVPIRIEIRPASRRWVRKKADHDCLGADPEDCFVWCLVETPARYWESTRMEPAGCGSEGSDECVLMSVVPAKTVLLPIQKVKTPASAREQTIPAETRTINRLVLKSATPAPGGSEPAEFVTITRLVLKRAAQIREEEVAPEYKTIKRKVVKTPATVVYDPLPKQYAPVVKRKLVREGGFTQWREIVCGEKITGYTVSQIQDALKALGYFKGAPEPTLGARTKAALAQFQLDRDLPADGNVDLETLQALGIRF